MEKIYKMNQIELFTRQTSIDVYRQIVSEGLLSKMRFNMYNHLYRIGPSTASEVFSYAGFKTNQSGRFTELRNLGVIYEKQVRKCKVTGRNAIEWDVTGNLPTKPEKRLSKKEQQKAEALGLVEFLSAHCEYKVSLKEIYKAVEKI